MSWSREQVNILIEEYKKHSCLYVVKSHNYKNKHARNAALTAISANLEKIRRGVTIAEIKSKFAAIRQNFLIEHRKHVRSLKSGAGSEQIYIPSIWYYNLLLFIVEHATPKRAIFDSIVDTASDNGNNDHTELDAELDCYDFNTSEEEFSMEESPATSKSSREPRAKKRKFENEYLAEASVLLNRIATAITEKKEGNSVPKSEDRIDIFLKFIATKMRRIHDDDILDDIENDVLHVIQNNYLKYKKKYK